MFSFRCRVNWLLGIALLFFNVALPAYGQAADAKWQSGRTDNGIQFLTYSATATLLGKAVPVSVSFRCDPSPDKNDIHGVIGFDFLVGDVVKLKPFNFDDFEGPDAKTGRLMLVTISRKGKPPLSLKLAPSGSTPNENKFVFEVGDETRLAMSDSKTILKALSDDGESMQITVTDSRNAKLKLELTIPVADKQAEFKALLKGLR